MRVTKAMLLKEVAILNDRCARLSREVEHLTAVRSTAAHEVASLKAKLTPEIQDCLSAAKRTEAAMAKAAADGFRAIAARIDREFTGK